VSSEFLKGIDAFGRMPCPGCGTPITVITHVDRPGSAEGTTTIDIDLRPMAEHMVECADKLRGDTRG